MEFSQQNSNTIETPYGRQSYSVVGEGIPVLIIHGSGGGEDQGYLIAERFFPACKIIAVSRFGYLGSDMPANPDNKTQAEVYRLILENEKISSAYIAALSAGGPSALEFAIKYADLCRGLILIAAVSVPMLKDGVKALKITTGVMARSDFFYGIISIFAKGKIKKLLGRSKTIASHLDRDDEHFLQFMFQTMRSIPTRLKGMLFDRKLPLVDEQEIKSITARTLIIHTNDDGLVPRANADYTASAINGSIKLILNQGGHLLLTQHVRIRKEIATFLK